MQKEPKKKLIKNVNQEMEEEDYYFFRSFPIICDFLRLNLQPIQALKGKINPKQA
jgi:hypothetical protein